MIQATRGRMYRAARIREELKPREHLGIRVQPAAAVMTTPSLTPGGKWLWVESAARRLHQSNVKYSRYRWNPATGTEVRIDPVVREIELVFWHELEKYLPRILASLRKNFEKCMDPRIPAGISLTSKERLTGYIRDHQA